MSDNFNARDANSVIITKSAKDMGSGVLADRVVPPDSWVQTHAPAKATQATKSQAAGAAGVKNYCTWLVITLCQNSTGSVQTLLAFNLRDGATGAGTILATFTLSLPATAGESRVLALSGLNIQGSAATAMTLESAGATAAETAASVSFGGYTAT